MQNMEGCEGMRQAAGWGDFLYPLLNVRGTKEFSLLSNKAAQFVVVREW